MKPLVQFVGSDNRGLITTEVWQATRAHCPRCGKGEPHCWVNTSNQPLVVHGQELRVFLCISCNFTALALNGFRVDFEAQSRSAQIIKFGFEEAE